MFVRTLSVVLVALSCALLAELAKAKGVNEVPAGNHSPRPNLRTTAVSGGEDVYVDLQNLASSSAALEFDVGVGVATAVLDGAHTPIFEVHGSFTVSTAYLAELVNDADLELWVLDVEGCLSRIQIDEWAGFLLVRRRPLWPADPSTDSYSSAGVPCR